MRRSCLSWPHADAPDRPAGAALAGGSGSADPTPVTPGARW
jgi:hypothetical protein